MRDVGKEFGQLWAVRGLSLDVPEGSIVGLIGPSGCGKTTTVRLLLGVYEPTEGEVEVFGERPFRFRRATRERLGYLPQLFVLYPTLTVDENLNFAAAAYGLGPFKRRRYKRQALDLVGLTEHRHTLASNISGGMQRRLELAATLLHQPELIVMDEPTAGIDPILREQLWEEFRRLQGMGRTQIITTQYVTEAEYCDFVVLMDEGKVAAAGPPAALRRQAAGGDLIDLAVPNLDRALMDRLRALPGVVAVQRRGDTEARLVVNGRAGELIPRVVDAVQEAGETVQRIEEYSLSFNEVFVALLGQQGQSAPAVPHVD
jgi:ABC-2 type transport system ATP-binding protein